MRNLRLSDAVSLGRHCRVPLKLGRISLFQSALCFVNRFHLQSHLYSSCLYCYLMYRLVRLDLRAWQRFITFSSFDACLLYVKSLNYLSIRV